MQQPKPSTAVPAGIRATLALLARIHADLDVAAQPRTAACSSTAGHVGTVLGQAKGAQRGPRRAAPRTLAKAS